MGFNSGFKGLTNTLKIIFLENILLYWTASVL